MGDPNTRKNVMQAKLRKQLKKKRESLADQFDYKMYIIFRFKDEVSCWQSEELYAKLQQTAVSLPKCYNACEFSNDKLQVSII